MNTPEELKQRRATLIKELRELDNQIQQAEETLKDVKKETTRQRFFSLLKQVLGILLKLTIWVSFFLARTAFFYYLCCQISQFRKLNMVTAVWLACGSDFLYTESKTWLQEKRKRRYQ